MEVEDRRVLVGCLGLLLVGLVSGLLVFGEVLGGIVGDHKEAAPVKTSGKTGFELELPPSVKAVREYQQSRGKWYIGSIVIVLGLVVVIVLVELAIQLNERSGRILSRLRGEPVPKRTALGGLLYWQDEQQLMMRWGGYDAGPLGIGLFLVILALVGLIALRWEPILNGDILGLVILFGICFLGFGGLVTLFLNLQKDKGPQQFRFDRATKQLSDGGGRVWAAAELQLTYRSSQATIGQGTLGATSYQTYSLTLHPMHAVFNFNSEAEAKRCEEELAGLLGLKPDQRNW